MRSLPGELPGIAIRDWMKGGADAILQAILSSVEYGVLLTGLDHAALACNRRFGEIFGIDIRQTVASDVDSVRNLVKHRIVNHEDWLRKLDEVYADPYASSEDILALRDPSLTLRRSTVPVFGQDGEPIARLWTFLDISRQARLDRMNQALQEMTRLVNANPKQVYEPIVEAISSHYGSLCVLAIREEDYLRFSVISGTSNCPCTFEGLPMKEAYCSFCLELGGPVIVQDARLDPKCRDMAPAKAGLTRYAGVPVISPRGAAVGTLCVLDDRSHEIHDEDDLRFLSLAAMRISSELDRERQLTGLERDLRETQAQLIQSEKLAVSGALSAAVAHDIRNILSALSLELSMGANRPAETLKEIHIHIDRFHILAHRLLSYTKPQEVSLGAVKVEEVLARVTRLLRPHIALAGIKENIEIPPDLPAVRADSARMDHLFINLMLNAIQSMPENGVLSISARADGRSVIVEVGDNGPGISEEQMARLFEPFSTSRMDGSGLGLYSCKQIVEEFDGEIGVETSSAGTTFTVAFPAYESRHPDRR